MRRSAAPSQLSGNAAKRGKFVPPFLKDRSQAPSLPVAPQNVTVDEQSNVEKKLQTNQANIMDNSSASSYLARPVQTSQSSRPTESVSMPRDKKDAYKHDTIFQSTVSTSQPTLPTNQPTVPTDQSMETNQPDKPTNQPTVPTKQPAVPTNQPNFHTNRFRQPFRTKSQLTSNQMPASNSENNTHTTVLKQKNLSANKEKQDIVYSKNNKDEAIVPKYYNVMWAKLTKKKHKKWEGDAILMTKGRSTKLVDMEGKEIGHSSGYKLSDLQNLQEGQSLVIGGKEIEVMNAISEEDWNTGQCFTTLSTQSDTAQPVHKPSCSKPFRNPLQGASNLQKQTPKVTATPKFNPSSPGALVMPRPSATHQWKYNSHSLPVVDVVVDPHVSVHLRPHQRVGVLFIYECVMAMRTSTGEGAILADAMGLGKTLQCIALIWTLLKQGPYGGKPVAKRVLVVTPSSLVKNWCQEFRKWLGKERLLVYPVGSDKSAKEFGKSTIYPVMIISYEMVIRSFNDVSQIHFDLLICDEGHRLKNSTIKTTSMINNLNIKRRVVLTGTPIQNDLQEFFSIVEFCNPGILGSRSAFKRVYEDPIVRSRQPEADEEEKELGEARANELSRLTTSFTLRRTQEVNSSYLPPKVESVVFCQPSQLQLKVYQQLLSSSVVRSCLSTYYNGTSHLLCLSALKKLCNHPTFIYTHAKSQQERRIDGEEEIQEVLYRDVCSLYPPLFDVNDVNIDDSGKLMVLAAMLKSFHTATPKQRVVVVSNYTKTLDLVQKLCDTKGYTYGRLDGSTPAGQRQDIVNRFNADYANQFVFLLSCKAGGVGLNLIGAARLILYDIDWNPANDLQAMARVWRDGQHKTVYIYRLLTTGSIEEKIFQRQICKQSLSNAVVDFIKDNNAQFSPDDLKDLFSLCEDTNCLTHDLLDCQCTKGGNPAQQTPTVPAGRPNNRLQSKSKSASMSELTRWQHHCVPFTDSLQDVSLLHVARVTGKVTFVLQTETQTNLHYQDNVGVPNPVQ
ncbi:DNA repair and recombination protein RAD54B-like [Glandiceps talaboti]